MTLGQKTKQLRTKLGLTQRDVANRAMISQASVSRLESDLTLQLKSNALSRLAQALNTTIDHLVGKEDLLTPEDILRSDPTIGELLKLYSVLDAEDRQYVLGWMRYLVNSSGQKAA